MAVTAAIKVADMAANTKTARTASALAVIGGVPLHETESDVVGMTLHVRLCAGVQPYEDEHC
jgi:hypothetical protein